MSSRNFEVREVAIAHYFIPKLFPGQIVLFDKSLGCQLFRQKNLKTNNINDVDMESLEGQVVFVTGAGGGIGKAIAVGFAKKGASVAIADIKEEFLGETIKAIEEQGAKALGLVADVTDLNSVRSALKKIAENFGKLNIAVNNAGVVGIGSIEEIEP